MQGLYFPPVASALEAHPFYTTCVTPRQVRESREARVQYQSYQRWHRGHTPVRGPRGQRASLTERIFSFGDAPLRRYPVYTESHL